MTMSHARRFSLLCATIITLVGIGHAQSQTLPTHHDRKVNIADGDWCAIVLYSKSSTKFMRYTLGLENVEERAVEFLWEGAYFTDGVLDYDRRKLEWQIVGTPFRPLAVAAEGGMGSVIYVVGWYERTGEICIEEWALGNAALAETLGPGGATSVSLSTPPITKTELYRGTAMGPAYDAVFHPVTRQLLMVADDDVAPGTDKNFYSLDVDDASASPVWRSDMAIALLPDAKGLKLGVTDTGAVYVFLFNSVKWGGYAGAHLGQPPSPVYQTHVFCDDDGDGLFEISFQDDAANILDLGETVTWNHNYTAAGAP